MDRCIVITIRLYLNEIEYIYFCDDLFADLTTLSRRGLVQMQIICLILHKINYRKKIMVQEIDEIRIKKLI
jgi:hypothetical protein